MEEEKVKLLDEISTVDLISELMDRCSPAIFIGVKDEGIMDGGRNSFFHYAGNESTCYGMCQELAFEILTRKIKNDSNDD